jgi:hypothetical protein
MTVLRRTQPYFVRCVKPNMEQVPNSFVKEFVLKQVRTGGAQCAQSTHTRTERETHTSTHADTQAHN